MHRYDAIVVGGSLTTCEAILATWFADDLPLESTGPRRGVSVLFCPYCCGYQMRDRHLAVIAPIERAAHQTLLLPDWGRRPSTLRRRSIPRGKRGRSRPRGVKIERTPVVERLGKGAETLVLRPADGREVTGGTVFTAPKTRMASPLAEQLGCAFADGMTGPYVQVDNMQQTSFAVVLPAGDAASQMYNVTFASAARVMSDVATHRAVVLEAAAA